MLEIKRLTVEEFDEWVLLPENRDRRLEYIAGEVVELVSNNYSSLVGATVLIAIGTFVKFNDLGWVTGADGGYRVSGERYIPDAAFVSKTRQAKPSREAYNPNAPDLAIEVISPTDDDEDLRIKIVNYLRAGTTVWVFDPLKKRVEIFAPNQAPQVLGIDDVIGGGDVLPGFKLAVKDVFPE